MAMFNATVMVGIDRLVQQQPSFVKLVEIVRSPNDMKGVFAKVDISESKLFIVPVSLSVKFEVKVKGIDLRTSFTTFNGTVLHACLQSTVVTKETASVSKKRN